MGGERLRSGLDSWPHTRSKHVAPGPGTAGHCPTQHTVQAADDKEPGERRDARALESCHNPSAKNPRTAVRATTVPPFAGTGLFTVGRSGVHRPKRICGEGAGERALNAERRLPRGTVLVATATIRVVATEGQIYGRQLQQAGDYTGPHRDRREGALGNLGGARRTRVLVQAGQGVPPGYIRR